MRVGLRKSTICTSENNVNITCLCLCVQEQSEIIWSTRDKLSKEVSKEAMKEMLEMNDQEIPTGESKV